MNYEMALNMAFQAMENLPKGKEFELKDLFSVEDWEGFGNYRGQLGTKFLKKIESGNFDVERTQKAARQSNRYIKK